MKKVKAKRYQVKLNNANLGGRVTSFDKAIKQYLSRKRDHGNSEIIKLVVETVDGDYIELV